MAGSLDVLRAPLVSVNLAGTYEFQQTQIQGVSLAVDADARARIDAAAEVAETDEAVSAVPSLIEMLAQDRISVVAGDLVAALQGGSATNQDARQAENMAAFSEADLACQVSASDALATIGSPAVPALIDALRSPVANRRSGAAVALGKIGKGAEAAVPMLKELLRDDAETVRNAAAEAVKAIKPRRWF